MELETKYKKTITHMRQSIDDIRADMVTGQRMIQDEFMGKLHHYYGRQLHKRDKKVKKLK